MTGHIDYDRGALVQQLAEYTATTTRSLDEILTQRVLNIAGRAFDLISPASLPAERREVKEYLTEPLSTKIKFVRSGPRAGKATSRGRKGDQLRRVNLILQARRARQGLKGLYGAEMRAKSGKAQAKAQISVGFLKSLFIPIIMHLNGKARFKFPFAKTKEVARWPNSAGSFAIRKSGAGDLLSQGFEVGAKLFLNSQRPERIVSRAINEAAVQETEEIRMHIARKLEEDARAHGSS